MNSLIDSNKMTSLQIAELTGKSHSHLMRDIRKMEEAWVELGQSKFGLISYIDSQNRAKPMYELTKSQCLYIATKFNDTARAKLVIRWEELEEKNRQLSPAEQLLVNAQLLLEQEKMIEETKERVRVLEAKTTLTPEYFAVSGYARLKGISVNENAAKILGKKASKLCKDRGIMIDTIPHAKYGKINTYPKEVLEEVFNDYLIS